MELHVSKASSLKSTRAPQRFSEQKSERQKTASAHLQTFQYSNSLACRVERGRGDQTSQPNQHAGTRVGVPTLFQLICVASLARIGNQSPCPLLIKNKEQKAKRHPVNPRGTHTHTPKRTNSLYISRKADGGSSHMVGRYSQREEEKETSPGRGRAPLPPEGSPKARGRGNGT